MLEALLHGTTDAEDPGGSSPAALRKKLPQLRKPSTAGSALTTRFLVVASEWAHLDYSMRASRSAFRQVELLLRPFASCG